MRDIDGTRYGALMRRSTHRSVVSRSRAEIVVYLSGKSIGITTNAAIPSGTRYEQVTGQPVDRISEASKLTVKNGVTGRSVTLAPYSITVIGY